MSARDVLASVGTTSPMPEPTAFLVSGGTGLNQVLVPPTMGEPRHDQLQGTPLERLAEIAGRVCYDSLGEGRSSDDWHKHVLEVRHLSVYEHCAFTVVFPGWGLDRWFEHWLNRPGLFVRRSGDAVRVTLNLRTVLDWDLHSMCRDAIATGLPFKYWASVLAPRVVPEPDMPNRRWAEDTYIETDPTDENEHWSTVWLRCSRWVSHELVRHGDWTAISQRSTRYVDEGEAKMCPSPDFQALINRMALGPEAAMQLSRFAAAGLFAYKATYENARRSGFDNKAARGIARDFLPHMVETQVVFSASQRQWNHIFSMRCGDAADAAIRVLMNEVRPWLTEP